MKKLFAILLILTLAAGLTACAAQEDTAAPEGEDTEATMTPEEVQAVSESNALAIGEDEAPASDSDAEMDTAAYEQAKEYIGQPVDALYEAIGEPESANYASSCEEENAEDGMLFYGGFYVWTVKTETEEIVHDVYEG